MTVCRSRRSGQGPSQLTAGDGLAQHDELLLIQPAGVGVRYPSPLSDWAAARVPDLLDISRTVVDVNLIGRFPSVTGTLTSVTDMVVARGSVGRHAGGCRQNRDPGMWLWAPHKKT